MFLAGCVTVPASQTFPDASKTLMTPCPPLDKIEVPTVLSEVAKNVAGNYSKYHKCASQVEGWIEWHKQQRDNFNKANK